MNEASASVSYRQSDAMREILAWSQDRDTWQRDALRQLINGTDTREIDLDRLEGICTGLRDDAVVDLPRFNSASLNGILAIKEPYYGEETDRSI